MSFSRLSATGCVTGTILMLVAACFGTPWPSGDPDPGHRFMSALEPVLSAIPAGVHVMTEHRVDSRWDSCDGRPSTFGWDPVSVDAEFTTDAASRQVAGHFRAAMRQLGWAYDAKNSTDAAWMWSRQVSGQTATTVLQIDKSWDPPLWSLDAHTPPAAPPVTGC